MKVIDSVTTMRAWSLERHATGKRIGFVPTMGYLHEGHLSLIRRARQLSDSVVVSIYVNPTQFGPNEDLDAYPRDMERDLKLCRSEGVDAVFTPSDGMMYGKDHQTYVVNESLASFLCGASRPTHFRGVITVVSKLFNIVDPEVSVFGQKDAQQALIIRNMVRDLNFRTEIEVAPIVREEDGLAMSSRNKYLSPEQRRQALVLSRSLAYAEKAFSEGNRDIPQIREKIITDIKAQSQCRVDYVSFVNASSLTEEYQKGDTILLALAVYVGTTRLIDNTLLTY